MEKFRLWALELNRNGFESWFFNLLFSVYLGKAVTSSVKGMPIGLPPTQFKN